jgi:thioredoxin-related protein
VRSVYKRNYHVSQSYVQNGTEATRKYKVRSFPLILFLDGKGDVICRTRGFNHADDALSLDLFVQKALIDPHVRASLNSNKTCGRVN